MCDNSKNKDIFLESIGNVKPLKRGNNKFKEVKPLKTKTTKKERNLARQTSIPLKITLLPANTKTRDRKSDLKIESLSVEKKLRRGKIKINKKVDFHGLSVDKAKNIFVKTIDRCFYSNKRCILFVTGKGMKTTNPYSRDTKLFHGKIRDNFQKWIFEKEVTTKILSVAPAGFFYGGDGAFFVYLRKNKN